MIDARTLAVFGWPEIIMIALVVVLLFGATKLPQIGRGLGEGIREFRRSLGGSDEEDESRRIEGDVDDERKS